MKTPVTLLLLLVVVLGPGDLTEATAEELHGLRVRRAAATPAAASQSITMELEITVTDETISEQSLLEVLRNLTMLFINGSTVNVTDPQLISECGPQGNETQCRCGAGLLWDNATCQALGPCSSNQTDPLQGCSCVRGSPANLFQCAAPPTASTATPTASTATPTASTATPTASTATPTASTATPTASTATPTASTATPTNSTTTPTTSTATPTASTGTPTTSTATPTNSTTTPTASTTTPTTSTATPTTSTATPTTSTATTSTTTPTTTTPTNSTATPTTSTTTPTASTVTPTTSTATPTNSTTTPTTSTATPTTSTTTTSTATPTTSTATPTTSTATPTTSTVTPTTMATTTATTPIGNSRQNITIRTNGIFKPQYRNKSSPEYKDLEAFFITVLTNSYASIPNFLRVEILEFREGSIVVDYVVVGNDLATREILSKAENVSQSLKSHNFTMSAQIVLKFEGNVSVSSTPRVGMDVNLTCNIPGDGGPVGWTEDGKSIPSEYYFFVSGNILGLLTTKKSQEGNYTCRVNMNAFVAGESSVVLTLLDPLPRIDPQAGSEPSKYVKVGDSYNVICCLLLPTQGVDITWTTNSSNPTIRKTNSSGCSNFSSGVVDANTNTYNCGVNNSSKTVVVTPFQTAQSCPINGTWQETPANTIAYQSCPANYTGFIERSCMSSVWGDENKTACISVVLQDILKKTTEVQNYAQMATKLPELINDLAKYTNSTGTLENDLKNVSYALKIMANIAQGNNVQITETVAQGFITTVSNLLNQTLSGTWATLQENKDTSSATLLQSVEHFVGAISADNLNITRPYVNVVGTRIAANASTVDPYVKNFTNASVSIDRNVVTNLRLSNTSLTIMSISFSTLADILPKNGSNFTVGSVVLSTITNNIDNSTKRTISMEMELIANITEKNRTTCVFWDYAENGTGSWSSRGCTTTYTYPSKTVRCNCDHFTPFSVLISPNAPDDVPLSIITYVGVGISIAALVCALILEAAAWRFVRKQENSRLRHIILINICASLLFADVWFIVAASNTSIVQNTNLCLAATFLMHLSYLSVFFWMLCEGLFLFYLVVIIFSRVAAMHLRLGAFAVGYGGPAIIAIVTIAVTEPRNAYTRTGACWLNWDPSKALLAFIVPAFVIVGINTIILAVVLTKILRRRTGNAAISDSPVVRVKQLAKSIAVMMPVLGVTWGLGIFAFNEEGNKIYALHVLFAVFNSLQGLFIFLFDCLMDKEVRKTIKKIFGLDLAKRQKGTSSQGTPASPYKSRSTATTDPRVVMKQHHNVRDRVKGMSILPSLSTSNYDSLITD